MGGGGGGSWKMGTPVSHNHQTITSGSECHTPVFNHPTLTSGSHRFPTTTQLSRLVHTGFPQPPNSHVWFTPVSHNHPTLTSGSHRFPTTTQLSRLAHTCFPQPPNSHVWLTLVFHNHPTLTSGSHRAAMRCFINCDGQITRQCPQTTTFEEQGKPKRIRTEVPLLTNLTPCR